jgi:hypothetical protein
MKNLIILTMILGLTACDSGDEPTVGSVPTDTIPDSLSEVPRYWMNDDLPLDVRISEDFETDFTGFYDPYVELNPFEQMQQNWEDALPGKTFFGVNELVMNQSYTNMDDFNDGEIGVYKSYTWYPELPSEALAVTRYLAYRRNVGSSNEFLEMAHADIIINYSDYDLTMDETNNLEFDLPTTINHELGHLLGLAHIGSSSAVMSNTLSSGQVKRSLFSLDSNSIRDLYEDHTYALTSGSSSSLPSFSTDGTPLPKEDEHVQGMIELMADGDCRHYENGELMLTHEANER